MKNRIIKYIMASGVALGVGALSASANTITPGLVGFTPGVSLVYEATLTSGEIHAGDGFTIFDIGGFAGFGAVAPGWAAAAAPFGSPWGVVPLGLDTALMNVTFTYTGAPVEVAFGSTLYIPFTVLTTGTVLVTDDWTSRDHLLGVVGPIDGGLAAPHRDQIPVTAALPDGGMTLMLLGGALSGLALIRRKLV